MLWPAGALLLCLLLSSPLLVLLSLPSPDCRRHCATLPFFVFISTSQPVPPVYIGLYIYPYTSTCLCCFALPRHSPLATCHILRCLFSALFLIYGRRAASQRRCLSPQRGTFAQPRRVSDKTRQGALLNIRRLMHISPPPPPPPVDLSRCDERTEREYRNHADSFARGNHVDGGAAERTRQLPPP
jgi:hypothetical protein